MNRNDPRVPCRKMVRRGSFLFIFMAGARMEPLYFLFIKGEKCRYGQSNIIPFKAGTGENRPEKLEKRQYSENKKRKKIMSTILLWQKGAIFVSFSMVFFAKKCRIWVDLQSLKVCNDSVYYCPMLWD